MLWLCDYWWNKYFFISSQIGARPNDNKKVVKVVSFGLSPIGEKYPQTKEKPFVEIIISLTYVREALLIRTCEFLALQGGRGTGKSYKMPKLHLGKVHE